MREFRFLYEDFVNASDVVQKRATRATTTSIRKQAEEDQYEGYLTGMSKNGTYGGQPELLAFVRSYNQDVMVHLPPSVGWNTLTLPYVNEQRTDDMDKPAPLHICYGGDEERCAHYDSSQKSDSEQPTRALTSRPKPKSEPEESQPTPRAVRSMKSDPGNDMMHQLVTQGSKDLRKNLDDRNARSPSASSHYSTSSKRSFDEVDDDQPRSSKRTDRKKRTLRQRAAKQLSQSPSLAVPSSLSRATSSGPPTPTSSTDSEENQPESNTTSPEEVEADSSDNDRAAKRISQPSAKPTQLHERKLSQTSVQSNHSDTDHAARQKPQAAVKKTTTTKKPEPKQAAGSSTIAMLLGSVGVAL